jgi:hypothetical protein
LNYDNKIIDLNYDSRVTNLIMVIDLNYDTRVTNLNYKDLSFPNST